MRREVLKSDLDKLYTANDMAKVGCQDCEGCWDCCEGMGETVTLDPLDVCRLAHALDKTFPELAEQYLELNVMEGVVLPNLRMTGDLKRCVFLNEQNRCGIHPHRPGFCRMFPLGRYYQDGGFQYFLQHQECRREPKTKVKVSKWLDTPNLKRYETYILQWHDFLEEVKQLLEEKKDERLSKDLNVYILDHFFVQPYDGEDFYAQFETRLARVKKLIEILKKSE